MGKQEISAATVGFVVSLAVIIVASIGSEGRRRPEVTVHGEDALPNEPASTDKDAELPFWLTDYSTHMNLIGVLSAWRPRVADDSEVVEQAEPDALLDSLSPGLRAYFEGLRRAREAAPPTKYEQEEAEYAAFIEERMRRSRPRVSKPRWMSE